MKTKNCIISLSKSRGAVGSSVQEHDGDPCHELFVITTKNLTQPTVSDNDFGDSQSKIRWLH